MSEREGRQPAAVFHPGEFIQDELDARGWTRADLAARMGGDWRLDTVALDFYLEIGSDNPDLRLGDDCGVAIARAFGVSDQFFLRLEQAWLAAAWNRRDGGGDGN